MTLNLMRVLQSSAAATTANSSSAAKPSSGELIWIIYWLIALLGSILSSLFLLLHSLHFLSLSVSLFSFSVPPPFLLSLPFSFFLAVPPHFVYISSPFPFYVYSKTVCTRTHVLRLVWKIYGEFIVHLYAPLPTTRTRTTRFRSRKQHFAVTFFIVIRRI